jgi:beta-glucanase (GH16 family)
MFPPDVPPVTPPGGIYKFQDEFDGPAGSAPSSKWHYALGAGGWGNDELQTYTNSRNNSFLDGNSNLVIRATKTANGYASARLYTDAVSYLGTFEAKIKVNVQRGVWPAWWAMGQSGDWPKCGEIDMFENYGWPAGETSVHTPDASGNDVRSKSQEFELDNNWHVFKMVWTATALKFYKDDALFLTVNQANLAPWVFSNGQALFMLLNIAIGGSVGAPPASVTFPVDMLVDYVRVW